MGQQYPIVKLIALLSFALLRFIYLIPCCSCLIIERHSWNYQKKCEIGFEEAKNDHSFLLPEEDPVLLLNGFGVGSFHQHRLIPNIIPEGSNNRRVYAIDYLGQGNSWPIQCQDGKSDFEKGLMYSIDTWADQIIQFIEKVIVPSHLSQKDNCKDVKVHLVGNSVGGYLSTLLARKRPDLVNSICLLNATPVWGLNLPGWNGMLPPPYIPRKIGQYLFDLIRNSNTIENFLSRVYANESAFDKELVHQIVACTEGKGGHAAFASILWSSSATFPGGNNDFYENLGKVECDVLLIFGKDDPWCKPAFAKRMFKSLNTRKGNNFVQRYIELDNVGHCPNHEAPKSVGKLVQRWVSSDKKSENDLSLVHGKREFFQEQWGNISMYEIDKQGAELSFLDNVFTRLV